jgi:hypothetical protein
MVRAVPSRLVLALLIAALALVPAAVAAGPQPPCRAMPGGDPAVSPFYGAPDGPPNWGTWHVRDIEREGWKPAECLHWYGDTRMVVALAARFRSTATAAELAEKLGAVSRLTSVKFWAITRQTWHPMAVDAYVVANPQNQKARLPDPTPDALVTGRDYFYVEDIDVTGRSLYHMRVLERTENRLVMSTENVTPITAAIVTLFPPQALQIVTFLDRQPDGWAVYGITRAALESSSMVSGYQSSYLNRLEAMRRLLADIPADRDPPIAQW